MDPFTCTYFSIRIDIPHQIWEAITTAHKQGTPYLLIRLFHNKVYFFAANLLRCYFSYLSPKFFSDILTPYGFFTLLLALIILWRTRPGWRKAIILFFCLYPLILVFQLQRKLGLR